QFVEAEENCFDANRCGEEAVAIQNSAGNHLAFRAKIAERKNWRAFGRGVAVDFARDISSILAGSIDQDEIGLEPAGGVERQFIVELLANEIFPGAFQGPPEEASDVGSVI